nr:hypothetical protein [Tanacetum cinerariifolium]
MNDKAYQEDSHRFIANCFNAGNLKMKVKIILTKAENPVKKILLKLNLSDHRKLKDEGEGTWFQLSHIFITTCSYPTIKYKDIVFQDFRYSDESKSYQDNQSRKSELNQVKTMFFRVVYKKTNCDC